MEKSDALVYLGKIQLDLINRKKVIATERTKLEGKLNRIESSAKPYGNRLSYNASRDRNSLKDKIRYMKNNEWKIQLQIDAIMFARKFMKEN
jgi:hypothetical protein